MSQFALRYGRPKKPPQTDVLHDSRSCVVSRTGDVTRMSAGLKWSKSMNKVATRFNVSGLLVSSACAAGGLEFLDDFSNLKELDVSVPDLTLDWRPVERLSRLEDLGISSSPIVRTRPPGEIDLTAFPALVSCNLSKYQGQ